jgi:hypothetical protein
MPVHENTYLHMKTNTIAAIKDIIHRAFASVHVPAAL